MNSRDVGPDDLGGHAEQCSDRETEYQAIGVPMPRSEEELHRAGKKKRAPSLVNKEGKGSICHVTMKDWNPQLLRIFPISAKISDPDGSRNQLLISMQHWAKGFDEIYMI